MTKITEEKDITVKIKEYCKLTQAHRQADKQTDKQIGNQAPKKEENKRKKKVKSTGRQTINGHSIGKEGPKPDNRRGKTYAVY